MSKLASPRSGSLPGKARRNLAGARVVMGTVIALTMLSSPAFAQRAAPTSDTNLQTVRAILQTPEADIDLAKVKLAIDHMIDPSIDVAATLATLDAKANELKAMLPKGASKRLTMDALRFHMFQASPWN